MLAAFLARTIRPFGATSVVPFAPRRPMTPTSLVLQVAAKSQPVLIAGEPSSLPLQPSVPMTGPSATSISGPNLPVPGLSGIGWQRDMLPLAQTPVTAVPAPGRGAPVPARMTPGDIGRPSSEPLTVVKALSDPNAPTTAERVERFTEPIDDRHSRLFNRLPDVGGFAPWQGQSFKLTTGRVGGVPILPKPVNAGLDIPAPLQIAAGAGTRSNQTSPANLRATVAQSRRVQKPIYKIVPGIGGLDVAMGPRIIPDTPAKVREVINDKQPALKLHGQLAGHSTAPTSTVQTLAVIRKATPIGGTAAPPKSEPVSTMSPGPLNVAGTPTSHPSGGAVVVLALLLGAMLLSR